MLKPGDFVGPYEIRGFVGQGGMGQVYEAFDPRLERTVALKIITIPESARSRPSLDDSGRGSLVGEFGTRLLREARAVASLSHPNVVAIFDVGESEGRLYLAMEYVVGSSLRPLVGASAGDLPLPRRVRWLIEVARALEAAHKAGIIHRDIKPENVMIRDDGGVKVLDFGIARRTVSRSPDEQHVVDTVTGGGSIAGTPVYMAPEQIKGGDVDARCDQFAWAVMAYELVTGERPWPDTGDVLALVARILTDAPKSIRGRQREVPAVVEETILRALAKDPSARFGSMADVANALEPFAAATTGGERIKITPPDEQAAYAATTRVPTTTSVAPKAPKDSEGLAAPPRRRALALATPLVLLGALAAAVYVVRTRPDPATPTPTPSPSSSRPLSTVPEAETAYLEAMSLWHDGAGAKAEASLHRAIELDRTFAAAHLELALQQASQGDPAAAQASFQNAYEHRHMLTARDNFLLDASQPFVRPKPDVEEWETRMTAVVFRYPRDPELQFYLGRARERQGDDEGAKTAFGAAIRLDDGFVPALAAMANAEKHLGNIAEGLATTDRCIKRSPVAATCIETRYELVLAAGECKRAREEATQWGALEPKSPRPFGALARALHADGAPRPSVEEVLARRWSLVPEADRKQAELWDRAALAVLDGDFSRADELARNFDAGLPHSADSYDHAIPARLRINLLMESDRMKDAAKTARGFLDRMPAWSAYPFAPDPSIGFYEPLYRAGELTRRELQDKRNEWLERERRRANEMRSARDPWVIWATVHGSFVETREEAQEAFVAMPRDDAMPVGRRSLFLDFALGKTHALLGRWDDAIPYLSRVVATCSTFDDVMLIAKARLLLGQGLEAKGEPTTARTYYEQIVETWPKTSGSRTRARAEARLAAIPAPPTRDR